ncbi:hypothetical protein IE4872_PD02199 (plasmid) [Rhizobium gallicum]|uniref:Uncharacterized protein n=1 Tax=Rhizobium gallicum TaxID=56730 RepID=A0A1L5NXU9_9HYPH|nr:hypothetical protein IE4872_PD02199 [Rhizobium gallicum]
MGYIIHVSAQGNRSHFFQKRGQPIGCPRIQHLENENASSVASETFPAIANIAAAIANQSCLSPLAD